MAAGSQEIVQIDGQWHVKGHPRPAFKILSHQRPSNIPGKSLIVGLVEMEPDTKTPPHTHGGAAVVGLTINGNVLNKMNEDEPFTCKSGDIWYEAPGCHHVRGENLSKTEKASFFAVFVVDDEIIAESNGGYANLVVMDADKQA